MLGDRPARGCWRLCKSNFCRLLGLVLFAASPLAQAATLHISVAASLTESMEAAIKAYTAQHQDITIVPVYASSSTLAQQIAHGAPSELFVSANLLWMDWLEQQGIALQARTDLLQNRLMLIAPADSALTAFTPGQDGPLTNLLGTRDRLSVGDPDHVPAGLYAKQAMEALGEWPDLEPRLARAHDVRAALALVERGETPIGIVYQTDARSSNRVRRLGLFPLDSHEPIIYPVAVIGDTESNGVASEFLAWLEGEEALEIFVAHGFSPTDSVE